MARDGRVGRARNRSVTGSVALRGTCPVCRLANVRVRTVDGKIGFHGKTAANPRGCPGSGQPPLRRGADGVEREQVGGTVIGFTAEPRPPAPAAQPGEVEVPVVSRREPELKLRVKDRPPDDLPPTG